MNIVKNKLNKIINVITTIIIILLCISVISNFQTTFLGKKYNDLFGYALFEVKTASMAGTVEINDWILVKITDDVKLRDVITFEQDGAFVTHRVVEVYKDTFITKGDSNNTKDTPIKKEQIIGKMTKVLPRFGIIKKTILNEKVLILLIITIYLFCSIFKKDKNNKDKILNDVLNKIKEKKSKEQEINNRIPENEIKVTRLQSDDSENELSKTVVLSKISVDMNSLNLESLNISDEEDIISKIEVDNISNTKNINNIIKDNEQELKQVSYSEISDEELDQINTPNEEKKIDEHIEDEEVSEMLDEIIEEEQEEAELENGKKKIGKSEKNIIKKNIELKKRELYEAIKTLLEEKVLDSEIKSLSNKFINEYINIKYLKQCEYKITNIKELRKLINVELEKYSQSLINKTEKKSTIKNIRKIYNIFILITKIDNNDANIDKAVNECTYINFENRQEVIKNLKKVIKGYNNNYNDFLSKLNNDKFNLITKRVDTKSIKDFKHDLIMTNISSSIQFSKIFSDYIINKTYENEIITEDLREVQLKLISLNVLKELLDLNYKRKYMIYLPVSTYKKEKKLKTILNTINDNYSQNKVYILIDLEILKFNHEIITTLKQAGYKFIIELSVHNIRLYDELKKHLSLVNYIILTDGTLTKNNIKELIPSYLTKKIIYVDKSLIEGAIIK